MMNLLRFKLIFGLFTDHEHWIRSILQHQDYHPLLVIAVWEVFNVLLSWFNAGEMGKETNSWNIYTEESAGCLLF